MLERSRMFCMRNIVGERVRLGRHNHEPKLTQRGLAEKLQLAGWDISRTGVAKIELGLRQVRDLEVVRLAQALSVPIAWFFPENTADHDST